MFVLGGVVVLDVCSNWWNFWIGRWVPWGVLINVDFLLEMFDLGIWILVVLVSWREFLLNSSTLG